MCGKREGVGGGCIIEMLPLKAFCFTLRLCIEGRGGEGGGGKGTKITDLLPQKVYCFTLILLV